jgi:putative signal transducing protein
MTTKDVEGREPVTVLETGDPGLLAVAKSLLESAEIHYFAKGEAVQDLFGIGRFGAGFNAFTGPVQLQVAFSDADEAIRLLRDLQDEQRRD